ncbi:hypothetical protein GIB67_026103 [Kingdonia uniflora]|uniref:Aminotransferase-like plant mobile domain-containing protein n=1 Tax=Kingdonia uniflora TaxID=39325 RepID=A0A7J7M320_9MAGN|nr:hypothetical protein GIB67_026103 [Kingdonia uniflora]
MGFEEFVSIKTGNSDNRLIHALVERWWPSTHTFHFPYGDLGVTPLDFVMLMGISFGRGFELPYDDKYSKFEEAQTLFPGINEADIRCVEVRLGTLIMAHLYRGLDEVSVLMSGKRKRSITGFNALLEFWFFEYYRVGMYLVKINNFNHVYPRMGA